MRRLADLCEAVTVGHVGKTSQYYRAEGVPFLRTQNVGSGELALDDLKFITQEFHETLKKSQLKPGDVLVTRVVTDEMKCGIVPTSLGRANCANVILIRSKPELSPEFLSYLITSPAAQSYLLERRVGSAQQVVNTKVLKDWPVPKLPIEEQKRIVALLDQAFAALDRARAHAEANRESCRELFGTLLEATLLRDASGWKRLPLKSLGTTQTGTTPKASEAESFGDFIPFIKPGDFKLDGSLELENQGLSELGAKKARTVPAGSALMVCIGATIGKAGFTETDIVTNQQINSVFPRDGISGEFLYYQFITPSFQKDVTRRSGQATLPIINKSKWSEIEVAFPSDLATQSRLVESLRAIRRHTEELVGKYDRKLADLANLRQSLLQKAFSGELT